MAGIKQPLQDVLTRLATLQVKNADGNITAAYVRVWNNQLNNARDGKLYDFPKPAFFVEIINNVQFDQMGVGFRSADIGFNIHIIHEFYDAQDGTFEQDLVVFDLRDAVIALLSNWQPTACSIMHSTGEDQDYDHDNLYHYIVSFVCNFTDSKGSFYDPPAQNYTDSEPPVNLNLTVSKTDEPVFNPNIYKPKI